MSTSTSLSALLAVDEPLVVVVDGDGQDLLGAVLADDVLVELFLDLARRRDVGEERSWARRGGVVSWSRIDWQSSMHSPQM